MTVVKNKRGESELEVLNKARELAMYTIKICSNEKNFPKRHRWSIINKIVNDAIDVHGNIRKANDIFVSLDIDYKLRREWQVRAMGCADELLANMDIAYMLFNVNDNRIDHWVGLVKDTKDLLRKWRDSDAKRYGHLID